MRSALPQRVVAAAAAKPAPKKKTVATKKAGSAPPSPWYGSERVLYLPGGLLVRTPCGGVARGRAALASPGFRWPASLRRRCASPTPRAPPGPRRDLARAGRHAAGRLRVRPRPCGAGCGSRGLRRAYPSRPPRPQSCALRAARCAPHAEPPPRRRCPRPQAAHAPAPASTPLSTHARCTPPRRYDPLGLATDEETLEKFRAAELIHGRWRARCHGSPGRRRPVARPDAPPPPLSPGPCWAPSARCCRRLSTGSAATSRALVRAAAAGRPLSRSSRQPAPQRLGAALPPPPHA